MPNIKSAKKRVKVIEAKTLQNKMLVSRMRSGIKKANAAIENGSEDKETVVRDAFKFIDKAAAKGILHKNTAARKKSALAIKVGKVG